MESGILRFILRHSLRQQVLLVVLSLLSLPILYLTFELPKIIINQAIGGEGGFPQVVLGRDFEQVPYLFLLCGVFLLLVCINAGLKYATSTFRYKVGDQLLRRLRFDLVERVLRFPPAELRNRSSGQIVSMITAETSQLGFFMAEAFVVPVLAAGTLLTIVLFMFMQNWMMGLAAIALYPVQLVLIPRIQRRVNTSQRAEVQALRGISERVAEVVAGSAEIHGHDTSQYELADFDDRLGEVYRQRVTIANWRYAANVLNQFLSQLTPFLFFAIGGYLAIRGDISLGSLVAVLAAHKDMYSPWKDLIDQYQKAEDARVKYGQLGEYFMRDDLLDPQMLRAEPTPFELDGRSLVLNNVVVEEEGGLRVIDGASVTLTLPAHVAIIGDSGSGRSELARVLARQLLPATGKVELAGKALWELSDSVVGRRVGFVGAESFISGRTLREALAYPLLHRPQANGGGQPMPVHAIRADWIDFEAAGCSDAVSLELRMAEVLKRVEMGVDVYDIGLRRVIDPALWPELPERVVAARQLFAGWLREFGLDACIATFERDRYNPHASVAENILFGTPVGPALAPEQIAANPFLLRLIEDAGLTGEFVAIGGRIAAITAELFHDLPPGHEFFERFSFIRADDLPAYQLLQRQLEAHGPQSLDADGRQRLMRLTFDVVVAQHHLDLVDAAMQSRLVELRRQFAEQLPEAMRASVQFFDPGRYNTSRSIVDNLLFGKMAADRGGAWSKLSRLVADAVDAVGIRETIIRVGMDYDIGAGASRLTVAQRQKLAIGRCLLKRPDLLILSDALASMDAATRARLLAKLREEMAGRSLLLLDTEEPPIEGFEPVLRMNRGRVVADALRQARARASGTEVEPGGGNLSLAGLMEAVSLLAAIPLFAGLDRPKLKLLAFTSERVGYEAGQVVFERGETGDHAYVVVEGEVDVLLAAGSGERCVATLGRNQMFGEMALLADLPRSMTLRARSDLVLLSISRDVFLRMVGEHSEIAVSVMRLLAERLASTLVELGRATEAASTADAQRT